MNLPFVLDVAIGLVFIYLILSLLASEIQELIATVLQWRAKHLKEAIEILLAGGTQSSEAGDVHHLVQQLYDDSLLKNINQEAKGFIAGGIRRLSRLIFPENRKGAFGTNQTSGPSYIAPDIFASSLVSTLGIPTLAEKLIEFRMEKFARRIVGTYEVTAEGAIAIPGNQVLTDNWQKGKIRQLAEKFNLTNLDTDPEFHSLVEDFEGVLQDFKSRKANLKTSVERLSEALNNYILASQDDKDPVYVSRLRTYQSSLFGENNERAIAAGGLRPSVAELAQLIDQSSDTYQEVAGYYHQLTEQGHQIDQKVKAQVNLQLEIESRNLDKPLILSNLNNEQRRLFFTDAINQLIQNGELTDADRRLYDNYQTYQAIQQTISKLPKPLKESLASLARRSQTRIQRSSDDLVQFREEVAVWFDRSMSRSSGVYKRNAKGVAIALGILLAAITNSDSFYIVDRLVNDENLRDIVTQQSARMLPVKPNEPITTEQLKRLREQANTVLEGLSLPMGWDASSLSQQFGCSVPPEPTDLKPSGTNRNQQSESRVELQLTWQQLFKQCLNQEVKQEDFVPFKVIEVSAKYPLTTLRILFGWIVTGVAIAMGAPFWFDLLGKFINVRNSGGKPASPEAKSS